jgi:mono/diheme cytochrome c family protein
MKRNGIVILLAGGLLVGYAGSCKHQKRDSRSSKNVAKTQATGRDNRVVTIALPRYQATLPDGPGRDTFAVACLSCHSSRYITTQPPLSAAKWEESVRKMVKTYSAPIAEEQVQPIVQYLMAAKENGPPGASWETVAVASTAVGEAVASAALASDTPVDLSRGAALYALNCASCHGDDGKGNTPAVRAQNMLPRPSDLTAGQYAPPLIARAIAQGVPGTAMPTTLKMQGEDLRNLTAFTKRFAPTPVHVAAATPAGDEPKTLFARNCASCHGASGMGDGPAAPPLARPPANFHLRQPGADQAAKIIAEGVPGTAMPPWKAKLTEPQRAALAEYVRSFYEAGR